MVCVGCSLVIEVEMAKWSRRSMDEMGVLVHCAWLKKARTKGASLWLSFL